MIITNFNQALIDKTIKKVKNRYELNIAYKKNYEMNIVLINIQKVSNAIPVFVSWGVVADKRMYNCSNNWGADCKKAFNILCIPSFGMAVLWYCSK